MASFPLQKRTFFLSSFIQPHSA